jgi:hypothetical protein
MKSYSSLTIAAFIGLTSPCAKADEPAQVNATVEIYELPQSQAFGVQKAFSQGTDTERTNIILNLRKGVTSVAGIKTVAVSQSSCQVGRSSQVKSVEAYRFPAEFDMQNGFAVPTAFEVRDIGCTTSLTVSAPGSDGSYAVDTDTRDVVLNSTAHYSTSKADQQGSLPQPIFTTGEVKTRVHLMPSVTTLVGSYAPYKNDAGTASSGDDTTDSPFKNDTAKAAPANNVLRMVFITIEPQK